MVPAFLRTLSARILLGFAILIVTFGLTSVWIVNYMDDLKSEIGVIRTGYLKIALTTKDLAGRQQLLFQYLKEELAGEGSPAAVERRIRKMRLDRDRMLETLEETLETMKDLPRGHARLVRRTLERVEVLRKQITALDEPYSTLLAAPPIDHYLKSPAPPVDVDKLEAAVRAQQRLLEAEGALSAAFIDLADNQRKLVERIAQNLERNESRLRTFTLAMGITAVLAGLLITVWATITLRPLARLRDAAVRIATGEHGLRLSERGPAEVADLAREFNVMARAIEDRERELVRSERLAAVGKMAAMITHEVRNPLSSIALNTELLGDELDQLPEGKAAEARTLCRAITNEVDRLTAITEEYLAFARLPKPRLAAEQLNQVASALALFVREDLAARGVALDLELADDLPRALADEGQLRQSLLNLVRNAAEAMGEGGGRIVMATRPGGDGATVEIEVRDDGPGIPSEVRARLFDPFVSTKEGGTGLGLALTHQIVREHGGEIRVTSEPGQGASFVVALPVADA
ncbi:MAG: HAMP domain-containing protein [Myxococcales bacterium]|nr:HAMP domain-containing protein [Myxococcales bacterium]